MFATSRSTHTVSFWTYASAALFACALMLVIAGPAAASRCIVDVDGANDDPGQKDVTQFCLGLGENDPFDVHAMASFDLTSLDGSNTADLCLLFDSDTDGNINVALCTTLAGSSASVSEVRLLTCNDSKSSKCAGAIKVNTCSGSGASCLRDAQCGAGETCAATFNTACIAAQMPSDPFSAGDDSPSDTVVSCAVDLDEFGPAGVNARLINMGAYSSSSLSSDLSDAVLPPMCQGDADCAAGQVCHLASGECYEAEVTGCTDNANCATNELCDVETGVCAPGGCTSDADCSAGKVCNVDAGVCETPIDSGCSENADCATGLVCNVATGECQDVATECTIDSDCAAGQVCNALTGVCEDAAGGSSCSTNSDCVVTEVCNPLAGLCVDPSDICATDTDCADGKVCNVATGVCQTSGNDLVCESGTVTVCDSECSLCSGGHCLSLCGNPHESVGSGVTATDSLYILRAAIALEQCSICVCDVNSTETITAVDALAVLRLIVRLPETLSCPGHP